MVGAVSGALPPVIGWVAVRCSIGLEALSLFLIVFLWQLPHFLAIAWIYREDYERGGFRMLPIVDRTGQLTRYCMVICCLALIPVSLVPAILGEPDVFRWRHDPPGHWLPRVRRRLCTTTFRGAGAAYLAGIVDLPACLVPVAVAAKAMNGRISAKPPRCKDLRLLAFLRLCASLYRPGAAPRSKRQCKPLTSCAALRLRQR